MSKSDWCYIPPRRRTPMGYEDSSVDSSRRMGYLIAVVLAIAVFVMWARS